MAERTSHLLRPLAVGALPSPMEIVDPHHVRSGGLHRRRLRLMNLAVVYGIHEHDVALVVAELALHIALIRAVGPPKMVAVIAFHLSAP